MGYNAFVNYVNAKASFGWTEDKNREERKTISFPHFGKLFSILNKSSKRKWENYLSKKIILPTQTYV